MTQLQVLLDWADIAIGTAFWTCALWPAAVAVFWPWWKHEWGLNMIIKTELIALAMLSSVLKTEFGVTSGYVLLWVTVLAITAIPLVVLWRTVLIWHAQRDGAMADRGGRGNAEPGSGGTASQEPVKP